MNAAPPAAVSATDSPTLRFLDLLLRSREESVVADLDSAEFANLDLRAEAIRRDFGEPDFAWWDKPGGRVRVTHAQLPGVSLRNANFAGVSLEQANFADADLADCKFAGVVLGSADLSNALLEDADLKGAHLRFAKLENAALEGSDLRGADLWGAKCKGADMDKIDFREAELEEADLRDTDARDCDFHCARLGLTDFRDADLRRSDFREAILRGTKFDGADLRLANLSRADLTSCTLKGVWLAETQLDHTRFDAAQLGWAIGEELALDWHGAAKGYRVLERNFTEVGDPEAASWAYRKRRQMAKHQEGRLARQLLRARKPLAALRPAYHWASDWLVELVCGYGDSVSRVFGTYLVVFAVGATLYGATGAVERERPSDTGEPAWATTRAPKDLALYSFKAIVAPGEAPAGLRAASDNVQLATLGQSALGVFLLGLLGFVAGNRIRR